MLYMHFSCAGPLNSDQSGDADFCRNGLFPREQENLSLGVIQGPQTEKVHFFDDSDGCPSAGAKCMRSAYVVRGDEILVGKTTADWACVWYQGRKHESVSWIPRKYVAFRPAPRIDPIKGWVGVWVDGADKITISLLKKSGELQLQSNLRWEGGISALGEAIAHFGGMKGNLDVQGSQASAVESDCQARFTRIGKYLVADDNGACGALNVRHTGVYFRLPK